MSYTSRHASRRQNTRDGRESGKTRRSRVGRRDRAAESPADRRFSSRPLAFPDRPRSAPSPAAAQRSTAGAVVARSNNKSQENEPVTQNRSALYPAPKNAEESWPATRELRNDRHFPGARQKRPHGRAGSPHATLPDETGRRPEKGPRLARDATPTRNRSRRARDAPAPSATRSAICRRRGRYADTRPRYGAQWRTEVV